MYTVETIYLGVPGMPRNQSQIARNISASEVRARFPYLYDMLVTAKRAYKGISRITIDSYRYRYILIDEASDALWNGKECTDATTRPASGSICNG